ncbi:hypothetical protein V8G54_018446 [Vigna mungo]|uniref:Uncharacterized protein n=1 Tax=Vigna mungo TaxID=3915 RepID=A0AAQ3N848_VIGMU
MNDHLLVVLLRRWAPPEATVGGGRVSAVADGRGSGGASETQHHPHVGVSDPQHQLLRGRDFADFHLGIDLYAPSPSSSVLSKLNRFSLTPFPPMQSLVSPYASPPILL